MLNRVRGTLIARAVLMVLVFVFLQAGFLFAQWETDVRLTTNTDSSFTSYNNAWCVAAYSDTVHAVWYDNRDGNYEIYYKRSDDGGVTWGADTRLTDDPNWSYAPSVAVAGSEVHVVWEDDRDQDTEVYYKCSTDNGTTWGPDVLVTTAAGSQGMPSVAAIAGYVHVTWSDFTMMGNTEIYYGRSTDSGTTWETPCQISNAAGFSTNSSIAAHESNVHIAWHDSRFAWFNNEIYYRHSTDGGVTWGVETRLTEDTTFSNTPSIAVSGSNVYVVWEDMRDGNFEMYYKHSSDGGVNWGSDTRLTNDAADSHCPSVASSGPNIHLVWQDNRDGNEEIYYKVSNDHGSSWDPDIRLTDDQNTSQSPSIATSGQKVHVVWNDDRDGNWEIYYKRNPTGNTGIAELTGGIANGLHLVAAPNPFSKLTTIRYSILDAGYWIPNPTMSIYDASGRLVKSFYQESRIENQESSVLWDGTDHTDRQLGSGVYFVKLEAGDLSATEKIILTR
jgi:hypothetical protein